MCHYKPIMWYCFSSQRALKHKRTNQTEFTFISRPKCLIICGREWWKYSYTRYFLQWNRIFCYSFINIYIMLKRSFTGKNMEAYTIFYLKGAVPFIFRFSSWNQTFACSFWTRNTFLIFVSISTFWKRSSAWPFRSYVYTGNSMVLTTKSFLRVIFIWFMVLFGFS